MRLCIWHISWGTILGVVSVAAAQQPLPATTVQLPTFSFFTVQTTVSVPDGGSMSLGGLSRGADRSVGLAPIRNRGLSSSRMASGIRVSATVIDHEAIDRAILAAAAEKHGPSADVAGPKAASLSKSVGRSEPFAMPVGSTAEPLPGSVAAIRKQNRAEQIAKDRELAGLFAQAQQAEADGKLAVAKVYYQMVVRRDSGQLKQQAAARLAALKR